MKFFVTNRPDEYRHLWNYGIQEGTIDEFIYWVQSNKDFQLDTETTMTPDSADVIEDRKLLFLQIGSIDKEDQWVFEHTVFNNPVWFNCLKNLLEDVTNSFVLHNAKFDYVVIKSNLNITVENIHDTYLMSLILNTGLDLEIGYHSLAGCLNRFLGIVLDKSEQTTFTYDVITLKQFMYAAEDVINVYDLFLILKELLNSWDLWFLYDTVEREVVKAYGDMEMNSMRFDSDYWNKLVEELKIEDAAKEIELNNFVLGDSKLVAYLKHSELLIKQNLIQPKSEFTASWGSNVVRKDLLLKLVPELDGVDKFTKPELKKFSKVNNLGKVKDRILDSYLDRNYDLLNRFLQFYHKQWLLDKGYFMPENTVLINWASSVHKLCIFQYYYPNLKNSSAKALDKIYTNPLINKYKEYSKVHKYLTTYGEGFKNHYVRRNDTIAPSGLRQILNTGRMAHGILLQMPSQARFRNAFLPPGTGDVFVDSDYSSAEVLLMACAAGETRFIEAVKEGKDLHMMSASLIFSDKWKSLAEEDCTHLIDGSQCKCKEHNKLRKFSKAITFGLAYGLSYVGLSERLDITRDEAKKLIEDFFNTFSHLKQFFEGSSNFGVTNNYIVGMAPTKRIRFFHPPLNDGERSSISRCSMNFPIQESNASILKIALIKLRKYLLENRYPAKLHLSVHDEIVSSCHKDIAEEWKSIQEKAMCDAADLFIEPGLLKTDTQILERWTK